MPYQKIIYKTRTSGNHPRWMKIYTDRIIALAAIKQYRETYTDWHKKYPNDKEFIAWIRERLRKFDKIDLKTVTSKEVNEIIGNDWAILKCTACKHEVLMAVEINKFKTRICPDCLREIYNFVFPQEIPETTSQI